MKVVSGLFSAVSTLAAQLMEAIKVFQYGTKVLHVAKKKKGGGVRCFHVHTESKANFHFVSFSL